jgi:hypothetical protein
MNWFQGTVCFSVGAMFGTMLFAVMQAAKEVDEDAGRSRESDVQSDDQHVEAGGEADRECCAESTICDEE